MQFRFERFFRPKRKRMRFALLPKRLPNGTWIWLENYWRQYYSGVGRKPEGRAPTPTPSPAHEPKQLAWPTAPQTVDLSSRLELAFEPIIDVVTEKLVGFHAAPVPRDNEEGFDVVVPQDRIGLLEFGSWSIETACMLSARWPVGTRLFLDISPFMPIVEAIRERIEPIVSDLRLPPERFGLVVSEDAADRASPDELGQLRELQHAGVAISLDCSSENRPPIERVANLRFDNVKLRSDAARETEVEPGHFSEWMKFAELMATWGTGVTAVGVASEDEVSFIRESGFTHAQGPHISGPVDARRALAMLIGDQSRRPRSRHPLREARASLKRRVGVNHQGYCYEGSIYNLSTKGAMIDGLWNVPKGTRLALQFDDDIRVWATARWGQGDRTGVEFDRALDLSKVRDTHDFVPVVGWRQLQAHSEAG